MLVLLLILCVVSTPAAAADDDCNLTAGFLKVDLPESSFAVQSPYDAATGEHTFWVYADDKPFNNVTTTNPRTEIRLRVSITKGTPFYIYFCCAATS